LAILADGWYIVTMLRLGNRHLLRALSLVLVAAFVCSQAFACCVANRKMAQMLGSFFLASGSTSATPHACCPKAGSDPVSQAPSSSPNGCCIKDANQAQPKMACEALSLPKAAPQVAVILVTVPPQINFPSKPQPRISTSPPLYLTSRSLLI
jgi:hypothetical protein